MLSLQERILKMGLGVVNGYIVGVGCNVIY